MISATLVWQYLKAEISSFSQLVGQVFPCLNVHDANRGFVLTTLAHRISQPLSILRNAGHAHRSSLIGAHLVWIYQDFVFALQTLPHVNDKLILVGRSLGKEIAITTRPGDADDIDLEKLLQSFAYGVAARQRSQYRLGIAVLLPNPGARFGTVLIFQPAVRIGDLHAVDSLSIVFHTRLRRRRRLD